MANEKKEQVKGPTGNRYDDAKKKEVLDFYKSQEGKRGGTTETLKKFGISYISLKNWLSNSQEKPTRGRPKSDNSKNQAPEKEGPSKRGRKANPNIAFRRMLEKFKGRMEKDLQQVNKVLGQIPE